MKKVFGRLLSAVLCVVMVLSLLPTTTFAAYTSVSNLPTSAGSTLYGSTIYRVTGNTTINAGTGGNALNVQSGATTVIYIPSGYTLTVRGGSGSANTPGGAGIYLPSNSTLILTGGGRLITNGGASGWAGSGSTGGNGYVNDEWYYNGGNGGAGGYGAGGGGAGIGTPGGEGGNGGSGGYTSWAYCPDGGGNASYGSGGSSGSSGGSTSGSGTLYVLGTITVSAAGGSAAAQSYGGSAGGGGTRKGALYWAAGGGGGGGGGGASASGYAIGAGGYGGGGGGGGGSGGRMYSSSGYFYRFGYGGNGGNPSGGHGSNASGSYAAGGAGAGGARGSYGGNNPIYKASTATINGSGYNGTIETHSAVSSKIFFQQQGGSGGASAFTINYGTYLPSVSVPTRSQHSFMGYYTGTSGTGTRYYDQRGAGLFAWENTSDVTLYAHWVQSQFNVSFDKQTGAGGTNSIITTGTDGTLPSISPPNRQYFQFRGYYDRASGAGTQYYDTVGTPVSGRKITANSVLYAFWKQTQFRLTFNTSGGTGGSTSTITTGTDGTLPNITVPTKLGSSFRGYFTQSSGGTQIYQANGIGVAGKKVTADTTLYGQWGVASYNITYNLGGGSISGQPTTRQYNVTAAIPNPTRAEYSFLGWQVDGGSTRTRDLSIPGSNASYAKNITLTAAWAKTMDSDVAISGGVQVAAGNDTELKEQLKESFDTMVTDPAKGVTTDDLADGKGVKLVLSVDKSSVQGDHGLIGEIAQGSVLTYYDISAKKEVTNGTNTTTTTLLEIPEPISVKIPLTGTLADKASYRVYRVHNGVAEPLPVGPTSGEYYNIEDGNVVIRTRKFSTYGVIGSETQIGAGAGDNFAGGASDVDVQGRVIEAPPGLVYKVDIGWGPMKFEYSLDREWDPDTHLYTEGALNAWRPASFDGENNKIRSINHSNGAVKLGLAVTQNNLPGVGMSLHLFNEITAANANSFMLPPAPIGSTDDELEEAIAFLYLSGSPESGWIDANKTDFTKVAVVTVTVEAHTP